MVYLINYLISRKKIRLRLSSAKDKHVQISVQSFIQQCYLFRKAHLIGLSAISTYHILSQFESY